MNGNHILKYGHITFLNAAEEFPQQHLETPGVCGIWSAKDIIAHLLSYECFLVEIFQSFLDKNALTPTLDRFIQDNDRFNDLQTAFYRDVSADELLAEYTTKCEAAQALYSQLPADLPRQNGTLSWYGTDYDLEDFLVYTFYGHKREHSTQLATFRDLLEGKVTLQLP